MKHLRFVAAIVGGIPIYGATTASTAPIVLTDANSSLMVDPTTQAGVYNYTVDGANQLFQQWYWIRSGAVGGESSVDTLSAPSISATANLAIIDFANATLGVHLDYTLVARG